MSNLGCSLKDLLPDDDMIESIMHAKRGIETSEDTLACKTIRREWVGGPGRLFSHGQTLERMRADHFQPARQTGGRRRSG